MCKNSQHENRTNAQRNKLKHYHYQMYKIIGIRWDIIRDGGITTLGHWRTKWIERVAKLRMLGKGCKYHTGGNAKWGIFNGGNGSYWNTKQLEWKTANREAWWELREVNREGGREGTTVRNWLPYEYNEGENKSKGWTSNHGQETWGDDKDHYDSSTNSTQNHVLYLSSKSLVV